MWKSHSLRRVVRSTLSAETISCVDCVEAALFCQKRLLELKGLKVPIVAIPNNKSLVDTVYSTKNPQDKRLRVEIISLRYMIEVGEVERLEWRNTSAQMADCQTKSAGAAAERLLKFIHPEYQT